MMEGWMRFRCINCGLSAKPNDGGDAQRREDLNGWLACTRTGSMVWPWDYCSHHPDLLRYQGKEEERNDKANQHQRYPWETL